MSPLLNPQPLPPAGVEEALSMPRTVLYADLGLRGNLRSRFRRVLQLDYEPVYIGFDGPGISWNYKADRDFDSRLYGAGPIAAGVAHFITAMETTSRLLRKVSLLLAPRANRRPGSRDDILDDLRAYWDARELHTTNLFSFWNVEHRLGEELASRTLSAGLGAELEAWMSRFLRPDESSYAELEKQQLARLAWRFGSLQDGTEHDREPLTEALDSHASGFGFLLAPFAPSSHPSPETLLARLRDAEPGGRPAAELELRVAGDPLDDCEPMLRELGRLGQRIAFWKAERVELMAAADARMAALYDDAAAAVGVEIDDLFALTRTEIEAGLREGALTVDPATVAERRRRYCLVLHEGRIEFFQPTEPAAPGAGAAAVAGDRLTGTPTSPGIATGRVVVIPDAAAVVRDPSLGERIREGDVLVTKMTRTEMDQILERAAAWVTDEGGRASHAAIMSREMRKPCVTGVGDATERLRDGMTVTVDGSAGEITVEAAPAGGGAP